MFSPHAFYIIFPPRIEKQIRVKPMIARGMVSEEDAIFEKPKIKTIKKTISPSNTAGIVFLIFFHLSTMD
jgi:hypothetical protein